MNLEVKDVNKYYGKNHVLKDVSFTATNNRTLGLLGRNGHGKSTIMKVIMGIISSESGIITLDGQVISQKKFKLGYLPEETTSPLFIIQISSQNSSTVLN